MLEHIGTNAEKVVSFNPFGKSKKFKIIIVHHKFNTIEFTQYMCFVD